MSLVFLSLPLFPLHSLLLSLLLFFLIVDDGAVLVQAAILMSANKSPSTSFWPSAFRTW